MPPFMVFLLFIGSIFQKRAEANTTTFFPGSISICGDLSRENPSGHEVGISLRSIILLPDEKECHVPPIGYNRDD